MQSVRSERGKAEAEKKAQHLEQVGTEKQPTTLNTGAPKKFKIFNRWAQRKVQNLEQEGTEKNPKFGTGV